MTADKPLPLVPKLRFPEFGHMPGWELTPLSDVLDYKQPGKYIVKTTSYQNVGTPVLTANKSFVLGHTAETDDIYQNVPVIIFDDFTTDAKYVDFPFKVKSSAIKILTSRSEDELRLVYELMSRIRFDATQHKRYFISQYQHLKIPLPGKSEQQKIADCLGSLDDLIAAEGRKLEALRQHKQGLMQQLFPQPGETVPRLRFPEFSEQRAWEETAIGSMGEVITGSTPSTSRRDFYGGGLMFVSPADISDLRFVEQTKTTLTEAGFAECRPIKKNSVLFVCIGSTIGKVAQCTRPCATNQQINSLVASPAYVADFAYYLLERESVRIARLAGKQAVPIINKSLFATVKVTAPAFAEQRRIATCLSSHDARIAAQVQKLNTLKTHKQGLLQQLFPSLETK